jgi:hypothetical protein
LQEDSLILSQPNAAERMEQLLTLPLTSHSAEARITSREMLHSILASAQESCPLAKLDELLRQAGVAFRKGRATIAWMLKYDLLRQVGRT